MTETECDGQLRVNDTRVLATMSHVMVEENVSVAAYGIWA